MPALYRYSVTSDRVWLVGSYYVVYCELFIACYIFICKSLWIKASAKCINININTWITIPTTCCDCETLDKWTNLFLAHFLVGQGCSFLFTYCKFWVFLTHWEIPSTSTACLWPDLPVTNHSSPSWKLANSVHHSTDLCILEFPKMMTAMKKMSCCKVNQKQTRHNLSFDLLSAKDNKQQHHL